MNHSEISNFTWGTADLLRSNFKRHEYRPLHPSSEVLADLRELEARIYGELARVVK